MHADDQHLLVIGAVEDADAAALRQRLRGAPEKIVVQFGRARVLEAEHLAALRIDARHHVADGAVLAGGVHGLKDQQQGIAVGRVEQTLQRAELLDLLWEELAVCLLRLVRRLHQRRPLLQVDLFLRRHAEVL